MRNIEGLHAVNFVTMISVVLLAVTVHEVCHGAVALRLGDDTAYLAGRLTLNPVAHIDFFGSILLPLLLYFGSQGAVTFAWAKPVPVNPTRFRRDVTMRTGMSIVAAAGPLSNIALASLFAVVYRICLAMSNPYATTLSYIALLAVVVNLNLALFNFIPIPPLDGSKVLFHFISPSAANTLLKLEPYGFFIILILFYTTSLPRFLRVLTDIATALMVGL